MRLLLDTHIFLWTIFGEKFSPVAQQALMEAENDLFLSAASYWEICVKLSLGKLQLAQEWPHVFEAEIKANRIQWLPIERIHCQRLLALPHIHDDPFDRLLVAQAQVENMTLVTADSTIRTYGIATIW